MQDIIISSGGQQRELGKKETLEIIQHTDPVSGKTAETAVMKCSSCTKYVKFVTSTPTLHPIEQNFVKFIVCNLFNFERL